MTAPTERDPETELTMSATASGQFSYHVRVAAVLALAGEAVESASESVLAWAMLTNQWPDAMSGAAEVAGELIECDSVGLPESTRSAALARARGLALDIEAHYVSVGCVPEATLYADVADTIADAVEALGV